MPTTFDLFLKIKLSFSCWHIEMKEFFSFAIRLMLHVYVFIIKLTKLVIISGNNRFVVVYCMNIEQTNGEQTIKSMPIIFPMMTFVE